MSFIANSVSWNWIMKKNLTCRIAQQGLAIVAIVPSAHLARAAVWNRWFWMRLLPQGLRSSLVTAFQPTRSSLLPRFVKEFTAPSLFSQLTRSGLGRWARWLWLLGISVPALAQNPHRPFTRLPYLQGSSPTQIHVLWRTEGPIQPVVRWGTRPDRLDQTVPLAAIVTRASLGTNGQPMLPQWQSLRTPENLSLPKLHSAPIGTFQYEAHI